MKEKRLHLIVAAAAIVLSGGSFVVVYQGASAEPYTVFRRSEAIVQIGAAMVLMLLWGQLAAGVIYAITCRHLSRWWLPLLCWALLCEFYLFQSPRGYLGDIKAGAAKTR